MGIQYEAANMATGPKGEQRPDDVAANAVHVCRLLVGDAQEDYEDETRRQSRLTKVDINARSRNARNTVEGDG